MNDYMVFSLNGKKLMSYTLYGTFKGEKDATIELLAYENNCKKEDITTHLEFDYNSLTLEDLYMYQYYYFECDADNKKIIAKRKED